MRPSRKVLFCLCLLASVPVNARASVEGDLGVQGAWTDNVYLDTFAQDDFITSPAGFVEASLKNGLGFRYQLNGYLYATHGELDALWQRAALGYRLKLAGKHDLEAELAYASMLHVSDTNTLDHHGVAGSVDLTLRPAAGLLLVPRCEVAWRTYPNTEGLDYVEAVGGLLASRSFPTKTTLRLGGSIYFRRFLQSVWETVPADPADEAPASLPVPAENAETAGGGPSAAGRAGTGFGGWRKGQGNGRGSGSQGPPPGELFEGNLASQSSGQALLTARAAQALGARVGAFLEGTYQLNFLDPPRFAEGSIPGVDRPFFDDPYQYEGPGALLQVSVLLPRSVQVELAGLFQERRYAGREALNLLGDPRGRERVDERYEVSVRADWSRAFDVPFPREVALEAGYVRIWNESNDDSYRAAENRVSFSVFLLW